MLWSNTIEKEVKIIRYKFECFCIGEESEITNDYQKIPLLLKFSVKFGGRHRSRLCYGGHITRDIDMDYCGGVMELETFRILFVIAALKQFNVVAADFSSA